MRAATRRALAAIAYRTGGVRVLNAIADRVLVGRLPGALLPARRPDDAFLILIYHRVNEERTRFRIETTPAAAFRAQMKHLARNYRVLHLEEIVTRLAGHERLPKRAVAVTFDDGYADNYHHAYPILRAAGIPATIFVTTGYVESSAVPWFDRVLHAFEHATAPSVMVPGVSGPALLDGEAARLRIARRCLYALIAMPDAERLSEVERLERALLPAGAPTAPNRMLTWNQIREMAAGGISFGSHTVTHPILSTVDPERVRQELTASKRALETALGRPVTLFAYPSGKPADYTDAVVASVRAAGYTAGLTTSVGLNARGGDLHRLRRVKPRAHDLASFALGMAVDSLVHEEDG